MQKGIDPTESNGRLGRLANEYRIFTVCVLRLLQLFVDGIDCLVPADLHELALAALAHALQRGLQAVFGIDVRNFVDAAQANGAVRLLNQVAGLDKAYALVADGALQIAPNEAVKLVGQMGHALARLGVRLGRCEPSARRCHAARPRKTHGAYCRSGGFEKVPTRHCALGRFRFRHLSPFWKHRNALTNFPLQPVGCPRAN